MSLPQFTTKILSDSSNATTSQIVRVVNNLIQNLGDIFSSLLKRVQLDSVLLTNVQLVVGVNMIPHTLGRTLTGYKIVRRSAAIAYYDQQDINTHPQTYLQLVSNVAATITIEVF